MRVLVLGVAFTDIKGFPFGIYDPVGTNKGEVKLTHGGVARNVAEDLARLGAKVVFPLPVDETPLGRDMQDRLEEAGVDMSEAISVPCSTVGAMAEDVDKSHIVGLSSVSQRVYGGTETGQAWARTVICH